MIANKVEQGSYASHQRRHKGADCVNRRTAGH
jgi:hypothetical protein